MLFMILHLIFMHFRMPTEQVIKMATHLPWVMWFSLVQILLLGVARNKKSLAHKSTEAEYRAVISTAAEVMWVQNLLDELGVHPHHTPVIYCVSLSATHLSANPVFHFRMKHLAITFYFVQKQV